MLGTHLRQDGAVTKRTFVRSLERSKKQCRLGNRRALNRKLLSIFLHFLRRMDASVVQDMFTFFIGCLYAFMRPRTGRRVENEIIDFGLCGLGPKLTTRDRM